MCMVVIRAKARSYRWLLLSVLGPFGFIPLAMLDDHSTTPPDAHQRFVAWLNLPLRAAYELATLLLAWMLAFASVEVLRELIISYQARTTGVSRAQMVQEQLASSGMWAFGETLEGLFLLVLLYLSLPIAFALCERVVRPIAAAPKN